MIGLYGATCNNIYDFAKALYEAGVPLKMILDRKDNFPHSQPVWEDIEVFFKSGFDYKKINWDEFEKKHNWQKPSYYIEPRVDINGWKKILNELLISDVGFISIRK